MESTGHLFESRTTARRHPREIIRGLISSSPGARVGASDALKWFTLAVIAVSGILATLSQYATIREGAAIASELKEAKGTSKVGKVIGNSQAFTLLTTALIFLIDIAVFGLAIWLVLDA